MKKSVIPEKKKRNAGSKKNVIYDRGMAEAFFN